MKRALFSVLFIILFGSGGLKAQWVTIPDSAFAHYLRNVFPSCMNGVLLDTVCAETINNQGIFCEGSLIRNFEGVKYFKNISTLNMSGNELDSLPELPQNLKDLYCNNNKLVRLPELPKNLRVLLCSNNLLSNLPEIPTSLFILDCSYNRIIFLPKLGDVFQRLDVSNNPDLRCFPGIKTFTGHPFEFSIKNTSIMCLPRIGTIHPAVLSIDTMPVCDIFNPYGCEFYWNIKGEIYLDGNSDCIQQGDEPSLSPMKLNLYLSGILQQSAYFTGGVYSFDTDFGNYVVAIDTYQTSLTVTCPSGGSIPVNITTADSLKTDIDFGLKCKPGFDVGVKSIVGIIFRPAWDTKVNIHAGDMANAYGVYCASGVSGSVSVSITGPASYVSPAPGALTPTNVSGNTVTYNVTDFRNINFNKDFNIVVRTDTFAQQGQQICFNVSVSPASGDNNPANNSLTHCFLVVTSYDPNDKHVSPITGTDNGWLTYTINFQNTGTDTAIHVYIDDSLDTHLDESTFQLLAYSHPNVTQLLPGRIVKFNFPNIYLPDSNVNEPLSHGYVQYRIKAKDNLPGGTRIRNKAYIYFDFNDPVETNTTDNLFCITDSTHLTGIICAGGEGYLFNDTLRTNTGVYTAAFTGSDGCDSIVTLNLTLLQGFPVTMMTDSFCAGADYTFGDTVISHPGNYMQTFQSVEGCDSVVQLELSHYPVIPVTVKHDTICEGWSYLFYDSLLRMPGVYEKNLSAVTGCDSLIRLNLAMLPSKFIGSSLALCYGGSVLFNDTLRTSSGIYSRVYNAANGCDSVVTLNLFIRPEASHDLFVSICDVETYSFKGLNLNTGGVYIDTLRPGACDSLVVLHLTVDTNEVSIRQESADTLIATGLGTVQWINCTSGAVVPGNNSDTVFTTTQSGTYAAVFSYNNCSDTTECVTLIYTGLPTKEEAAIILFPNPTDGWLQFRVKGVVPETVRVYDLNGRKLLDRDFISPLDLHLLQSGSYYAEVQSGQRVWRLRFIRL